MSKRKSETPMHYRNFSVRKPAPDGPATIDEKNRSVEVIGATETPVDVFDWQRYEIVQEILLMDGLEMPANRQVPMLDNHARYDTSSVLGSYREMSTRDGQLTGRVFFSSAPEADGPFMKLREGHLTDFSAGYRVVESTWIEDGQTAVLKGRSFKGPMRVTTRWRIKELSITPIGADELAKARAEAGIPATTTKSNKENQDMNEKLRKLLISRGMLETATEEEAWAFLEKLEMKREAAPEKKEEKPAPNLDAERAAVIATENARVREIDACCRKFGCPDDLREKLVAPGISTTDALRQASDWYFKNQPAAPGYHGPATIQADERDKFRAAALDGILLRSGDVKVRPEKPAPGAIDLMGHSLREMARHCLVLANQPSGGNAMEMVGRALITSDFPYILAAGANKSLLAGFEAAEETWKVWASIGPPVPDFKAQSLVRPSETSDLDEVPEHGEFLHGKALDSKESVSVITFGKLFAITRQAIINDDLGALLTVPSSMGQAAARKVGDLPYAVLTGNPTMGDGTALFVGTATTGHKNYIPHGSGGVPGIATLAAGVLCMGLQKDTLGKRRLNLRPQYFIAPKTLEGVSEVFFRSERFSDNSTVATDSTFASSRVNPYAGSYLTRVYDSRLDDSDVKAWFMAAQKGMTVAVFFLNGMQAPYMETRQGWSVDGTEYKVRIDAAAKALDWRGLFQNNGD
jgi:hypothetical protein